MSEIPNDLLYTKDHEWVMIEDSVAVIGITDHAQTQLGDITYIDLPDDDGDFHVGDEVASIESVKAASPVFAPVTGRVLEVNTDLDDDPGTLNSDPYGAGWILKIEMTNPAEAEELIGADEYEAFLATEAED